MKILGGTVVVVPLAVLSADEEDTTFYTLTYTYTRDVYGVTSTKFAKKNNCMARRVVAPDAGLVKPCFASGMDPYGSLIASSSFVANV